MAALTLAGLPPLPFSLPAPPFPLPKKCSQRQRSASHPAYRARRSFQPSLRDEELPFDPNRGLKPVETQGYSSHCRYATGGVH